MRTTPLLSRARAGVAVARLRTAPPVRMVHVGLGAFHRAHQAWYTDVADETGAWGIAAFTARSPVRAVELADQGGLYTVIERAPERDRSRIVGSIAAAHDGSDLDSFLSDLTDPDVAIVTTTVTEAGYRIAPDGRPVDDPAVNADVEGLRGWHHHLPPPSVVTVPGRLLLGLEARRRVDGGPLAIAPCDNLRRNGDLVRERLAANHTLAVDLHAAADLSS